MRLDDVLLIWQTEADGVWRALVSAADGLVGEPTQLDPSLNAWTPALVSQATGFALAWYEGTDTRPCEHNGSGPSRILLRRLTPDGTTDGMPESAAIETDDGARTAPDLATGDDGTVGVLWWRASIDGTGICTLRFGAADAGLNVLADGGVIGPGISGHIATADGSYRIVWKTTSSLGTQQLGFASFDRGAILPAPPVLQDLPFSLFVGDVELAAGDHGLVAVVAGWDDVNKLRLYFLRTDLLGRAVGEPDAVREVDPTCHQDLDCSLGPYNVVWSGDAFLVIYFATLHLGEPTETTEMRMVRLVPET